MRSGFSVLVVDDDGESGALLGRLLEELGHRADHAGGGRAALERLARAAYDLVLLDVVMPELDGLQTLARYRASGGALPVVMVSSLDEATTALQAVRRGATDYLTKPFDPEELREVIERVVGGRVPPADAVPADPLAPPSSSTPRAPGGPGSPAMQRVADLIARIADVDVPILITGESGVGKNVAAREIHARSTRQRGPFVKINCAALPGELLESELFGHERGSFTGAARTKPGQFELADHGTLFLDEIGEMPVALQAKLLQALQDGEFYRVGGQRRIRVDARVIVATNRDLARAIREGSFREDLYYRLNVVPFEIPPLRQRREDIPALLDHFLDKYARRYGRSADMTDELRARFYAYDWPGNVRELENLVRRLMVLGDASYVLAELPSADAARRGASPTAATSTGASARYPPLATDGASAAPGVAAPVGGAEGFEGVTRTDGDGELRIDLKEVGRLAAQVAEREAIVTMLTHTAGNKREAARRLGISYKAILYKIREFGVGRPRSPRRPSAAPEVKAVGEG